MLQQTQRNVSFVHPELSKKLADYYRIKDCKEGQSSVKLKGETYLPKPNAKDLSEENKARYEAYLERAVFYNSVSGTLKGLVGQIFMRDPKIKLPEKLKHLEKNANGSGLSLIQHAKQTTTSVIAYGRAGLFVDFPRTEGKVTVADIKKGLKAPRIHNYEPWQIINWRTKKVGASNVLSMVVIKETVEDHSHDFATEFIDQYRVLRLGKSSVNINPDIEYGDYYVMELWAKDTSELNPVKKDNWILKESYQPKDSSGKPMTEIPFTFIGSSNNDVDIDDPPMIDLANLNIGHFRNSADFEESCFIVGQPTPWFSGLTEFWAKKILGDKIALGSRAAVPLPERGQAGLLQAKENTMPEVAMKLKQEQMISIGAKLVERSNVEKTATEVIMTQSSEMSTLESTTKNVTNAYVKALDWCSLFVGESEDSITFELNEDFKIASMTPEERRQQVEEWNAGLISWTEARNNLRRSNLLSQEDDSAKVEIEKHQKKQEEKLQAQMAQKQSNTQTQEKN